MKKFLCLSLAAVVLFGVLFGCGKKTSQQDAAANDTLQTSTGVGVSLGEKPDSMLPAYAVGDNQSYVYHLFEGLYRYDETGVVAPGAAETESVDESGRVWTFTIRSDARWSDGEPVRAQDFVYAWRRAVSPDAKSPYASLFLMIENAGSILEGWSDPSTLGVEAVSDSELRVTFTQPVWRVSSILAHQAFSPLREDLAEDYFPANGAVDYKNIVTNGAYTVYSFDDSETVFARNDQYYLSQNVANNTLRFRFFEQTDRFDAFEGEEIDFAAAPGQDAVTALYGVDKSGLSGVTGYDLTYAALNNASPLFCDASVRRAFVLSVRQSDLCTALLDQGMPAGGLVSDAFGSADSQKSSFRDDADSLLCSDAAYAENLLLAKQLLSDAGFADPADFPTVTIVYDKGNALHAATAKSLAQCWRERLSIDVQSEGLDAETLSETLRNGSADIAIVTRECAVDRPSVILSAFVTGANANAAHYSSLAYDAALSAAANAGDLSAQYAQYHAAESALLSDAGVAPLFFSRELFLQSERLQNVVAPAPNAFLFTWADLSD